MLRLESDTGWWLVTHVDHARLAGMFAIHWGNSLFHRPEPRDDVMEGISTHDDGWEQRDSVPEITRQGKPSAFSSELVGKYSAFRRDRSAGLLGRPGSGGKEGRCEKPVCWTARFDAYLRPSAQSSGQPHNRRRPVAIVTKLLARPTGVSSNSQARARQDG